MSSLAGALLVALALAGCASLPGASAATRVTGTAPVRLASSAWAALAVPSAGGRVRTLAVSPAEPRLALACTTENASDDGTDSLLTLWRTTDGGDHWTRADIPTQMGFWCSIAFAPDAPARVAVLLRTGADAATCTADSLYTSDDGGAHWAAMAHTWTAPTYAAQGRCDVVRSADHIYIYRQNIGATKVFEESTLLRADDAAGSSWAPAGPRRGEHILYWPPTVGPEGRLVTLVGSAGEHGVSGEMRLVISDDAGQTWRELGTAPQYVGVGFLAAPGVLGQHGAWPDAAHPIYALSGEQLPIGLYREQVYASADGATWAALPPLPIAGASVEHPGILQALAVAPDGRLAVFGPNPSGAVPTPGDDAAIGKAGFWLWLWDPHARQWQVLSEPFSLAAPTGCGLCWHGEFSQASDGVSLTVSHFTLANQAYRIRLPIH